MILKEIEGPFARRPRSNAASEHLLLDLPSLDRLSIERDPLLYGSNDLTSINRSLILERTFVEKVSLTEKRSLFDAVKEPEREMDPIMDDLIKIRKVKMNRS